MKEIKFAGRISCDQLNFKFVRLKVCMKAFTIRLGRVYQVLNIRKLDVFPADCWNSEPNALDTLRGALHGTRSCARREPMTDAVSTTREL